LIKLSKHLAHDSHQSYQDQLRLVLAILSPEDLARFRHAILRRHLQVLDQNLVSATNQPCMLALVGLDGETHLYGRGLPVDFQPPLSVYTALQRLLGNARFHDGALLVLGRDRPRELPRPQAPYPSLLVELRESLENNQRLELCDAGLAGLRRDERSAVSAVLRWERGRLNTPVRPETAVVDFAQAATDFRAAAIPARARAALRWARRIERDRQLDLFALTPPGPAPSVRYEVVPAMLAEDVLSGHRFVETQSATPGLWVCCGTTRLYTPAFDGSDLAEAPVVAGPVEVVALEDGSFELLLRLDLVPRIGLGLSVNEALHLRCALNSDDWAVEPGSLSVPAGGQARFILTPKSGQSTTLSLTVLSEAGQYSQISGVLSASPRGRNANIRVRGLDTRYAA